MDQTSRSHGFRPRNSIESFSRMEDPSGDTPSPKSALYEDGGLSSSNSPGGTTRMKEAGKKKEASFYHSTKKKPNRDPYGGFQPPIKNIFDILNQTRVLVGMVQNVWGFTNSTTTYFRNALPGLCRVHVGHDVYILQGYLLQDVGALSGFSTTQSRQTSLSHTTITDPSVQEVHVKIQTSYFPHVMLLLKLRWLIRLHSACCELDYKQCSLKNLILGLQTVVLQHCAEAEADSGFDNKVVNHVGSHINLESVLDDMTDQLQRALGKSWRSFLEFVATCDPSRSVHASAMDRDKAPVVVSNDSLAAVIDSIFIADFLRQPRTQTSGKLRELYKDLEMLGIPTPELPPLRAATNLRAWAIAKTKPTRKDREKGGGKQMEKLAQQDFVALTCALELHNPEVMASKEEIEESASKDMVAPQGPSPSDATQIKDLGMDGDKPASAGPPAARIIVEEKPRITRNIVEGSVAALQHHITFPDGIRERLFKILSEEYGLTQEESERVGIATSQNIDGHRLAEHTLLQMDAREKVRIRNYSAYENKECSHLLVAPLVPAPCHKGKPAQYTLPPTVPPRPGLPGSAFGSVDMTRSLPDLRGFTAKNSFGRSEFKVPLSTGPLTMDPDLNRLRTTGFFIKMPPLKYS